MKRGIFTLVLCALVVAFSYGQQPSGVIKKVTEPPVIGGEVDAVWTEANVYNIDQNFQSELPTLGASGETNWRALWSTDGIYILLTVTDDVFFPNYAVSPAGNNWEYDKPEIYFDVNYVLQDALGPANAGTGHYQVSPGFTDGKNDGTVMDGGNNIDYAFVVTAPNYTAEYFVPFSWLKDKDGIMVDLTGNIGFDVTIIDRDAAAPTDATRRRAVWANIGGINESWSNMDECGIITFEDATAGIDITSITLSGGKITTDNGTLQVAATILPEDATNKTLTWSIENNSGRATISSTGIVTAIKDGAVTVTAKATDGSYEEGSCTVTISGQNTILWELNVIANGGFDLVNDDGTAALWSGWGGDANAPMPQIIDGIAVCTPVLASYSWQYQFNNMNVTALPDVDYIFKFKAWADANRTFNVDFEDTPANNYNRYGASADPTASGGRSDWTFNITTEPAWYLLHVNFDQIVEGTVQKVQFMLGLSSALTYIDSVMLVTLEEYNTVPQRVSIYDTITIYDTVHITVYDTVFIAVTDTLIINTSLTGINPPDNVNEIRIYPNPAKDYIIIDYGNYTLMNGYTLRITNSIGQQLFLTPINKQTDYIDISGWGGRVIYFVHVLDNMDRVLVTKKIIIH